MNKNLLNKLSLKEKIAQMLIFGFEGETLTPNIKKVLLEGLGGVIFFTQNIKDRAQFSDLCKRVQNSAKIPAFTSIDQEGGLVERTIALKDRIEYLTPMALAQTQNLQGIEAHYQIMAKELKSFGINMDFAPVLDVNTNPQNPIIGLRSFGENPEDVMRYSQIACKALQDNGIIAVGKHFPGHGDAFSDSHLEMPYIDLSLSEIEQIHLKPFKKAVSFDIGAVMIAHVHYKVFNKNPLPASLSSEIIEDYLRGKLGFKGLVISDDMVMGGIANSYGKLESAIKAINAGNNILIYRNSDGETLSLIEELEKAVKNGVLDEGKINFSVQKILEYKEKFGILSQKIYAESFSPDTEIIEKLAEKAVKIVKKGALLPLNPDKKTLIISPDRSKIHHFIYDKFSLKDFLSEYDCTEINYSPSPEKQEQKSISALAKNYETVIFITYNQLINKEQLELYKKLGSNTVIVCAGMPDAEGLFDNANSIINIYGYKPVNIQALAKTLKTSYSYNP